MCGRVTLHDVDQMRDFLRNHYQIEHEVFPDLPRFNIAPKQNVWSIIFDGKSYRVGQIPWGLMIQTKDKAYFNINAKKESLKTYHYFKSLHQKKRALIIVNGYYEWQDQGDYKQPFYIHHEHDELMVIAALWDKSPEGFGLTVMTQPPVDTLSSIHHRMPVILTPKQSIHYLIQGDLPNGCEIPISYHEVSHQVNSTKIDDASLINSFDAYHMDGFI